MSAPAPMFYRTAWLHAIRTWLDAQDLPPGVPTPPPPASKGRVFMAVMVAEAFPDGHLMLPPQALQRWGISDPTRRRWIAYLRRYGLVTTVRHGAPGRAAKYRVLVPDWLAQLTEPELSTTHPTPDHSDPVYTEHRITVTPTPDHSDPPRRFLEGSKEGRGAADEAAPTGASITVLHPGPITECPTHGTDDPGTSCGGCKTARQNRELLAEAAEAEHRAAARGPVCAHGVRVSLLEATGLSSCVACHTTGHVVVAATEAG